MKSKLLSVFLMLMSIGISAQTFTLKSKDLGGQFKAKQYANSFGCNGDGESPQLSWENAPAGTESFAVTVYDPDAPTGSGFWHWVVYNIPSGTTELKTDAGNANGKKLPKNAIQALNDGGAMGYMGPCPPPGPAHRYIITVYALKTKLELDKNAGCALIGFNIKANVLAQASIIVYGQR